MNEPDIAEEAPSSRPRPNWRKRLLIGGLIAVPLCLALPCVYFILSSNQELEEAFAEADWLDPGWRIADLEQRRARIRDSENSGLVLMAARPFLPPNWPFWDHPEAPEKGEHSEEELDSLHSSFTALQPCNQVDDRQTKALRAELRRAESVLAAVRKVADLPRGRYPITYAKDFISTPLPHLQDARRFGTFLEYDVLLRAQDGDVDGALTSCRCILNCDRSIGDEPTLISMLVRHALSTVATKKAERTLAQGEPSEDALAKMQREFEAEAEESLLLIGARGERGITDGLLQAIQAGNVDLKWLLAFAGTNIGTGTWMGSAQLLRLPGAVKRIRAAVLRHNNRLVEIAKLPLEQQTRRIKELQDTEKQLPEVLRPMLAAASKVADAFHRGQANLRCAAVMLAIERYRRANKGWPKSLGDLVPAYLPTVPVDPFTGSPLLYRRLDDGVVVYSVGPDGKDDGGPFDPYPTITGKDIGFRLWDVPKRRQPPRRPEPSGGESGHERPDGESTP